MTRVNQEAVSGCELEPGLEPGLERKKKVFLVLGVLCIIAGMGLLFVLFVVFKPCAECDSSAEQRAGGVAVIVLLVGGIVLILRYRKQRHAQASPPPVVISEIPVRDLEKSPAALLSYDPHAPHHQPSFNETSSLDSNSVSLPDYNTVVHELSSNTDSENSQSADLPDYLSTVINSNYYGVETTTGELMDFNRSTTETIADNDDCLGSLAYDTRL